MTTARGRASPELLLELDGSSRRPLRVQLEDALRNAIRDQWLAPGAQLPSTRALAADLGVSRRLVVEAYEQLAAEGYLVSRTGSGTRVALTGRPAPSRLPVAREETFRYDFRAGIPDLALFPRTTWARAMRNVLRSAPDAVLSYPDPAGALALRRALCDYLHRARGVVAADDRIVISLGYSEALWLIGHALRAGGAATVAVEDPGTQAAYRSLRMSGVRTVPIPVDEHGIDMAALEASGAAAVVLTPAHQFPTGAVLSAERRTALLRWAERGGVVIEDDYDAEFRYDRAPVGALQGLAPEQVVYVGSTSKTLAPALRLAWLVTPARLVAPVVQPKATVTRGSPVFDQLAFAELIESSAYDRHLRLARRRYRERRDALARALQPSSLTIEGISAGLHAVVRLPDGVDAVAVSQAAERRSVAVMAMSAYHADPTKGRDALVLGYAGVSEAAIHSGVAALLSAAAECGPA